MQRFGLYYLYKIYLSIFYFPHLPEVRSVLYGWILAIFCRYLLLESWLNRNNIHLMCFSTTSVHIKLRKPLLGDA